MRAVVLRSYGGPEVLTLEEVADPVIGPEEVLVDVRATALNRADLLQRMGLYPPGSLLELSDGRWVVSVSGGRDAERFAWPVVRLVRDKEGRPREGGEETDLFVLREFVRPKRVLNPASVGIDAAALSDAAFPAS